MLAIYLREMRSYFTTSIGYIFLASSLVVSAIIFSVTTVLASTADASVYFAGLLFVLMLFLPVLTMKSFSEEKRSKTEQLLLTSPISTTEMVLAKFFSALSMLIIFLALSCTFLIPLNVYVAEGSQGPNTALVIGNLMALLLVGMCFIAIGIFVSSLTENQFAAIVITIVILLALLLINLFNAFIGSYTIRSILNWLSIYARYEAFTYGIFDIGALIYYLSITGVFLFLTVRVFEARKYN
ncbi:MAG: ABC transporter permease subunit [Clostridia bacterium]|nr:ABC transporter permease subunit [Clostridia bacterium]